MEIINNEKVTYELINEEQETILMGLFLDLTKAFDCLEHIKLLESAGIKDNQLKLTQLANR